MAAPPRQHHGGNEPGKDAAHGCLLSPLLRGQGLKALWQGGFCHFQPLAQKRPRPGLGSLGVQLELSERGAEAGQEEGGCPALC